VIGYDTRSPMTADDMKIERPVTRETFALRTDNDIAQIAALKAGFGIGVVQHGIARRAGLVEVMPGALTFRLEMWVCMHENLKTSRRMRLMFDHLAAELGKAIGDGN
jgi:DNA-binding transcriptional LysR family regulator